MVDGVERRKRFNTFCLISASVSGQEYVLPESKQKRQDFPGFFLETSFYYETLRD